MDIPTEAVKQIQAWCLDQKTALSDAHRAGLYRGLQNSLAVCVEDHAKHAPPDDSPVPVVEPLATEVEAAPEPPKRSHHKKHT